MFFVQSFRQPFGSWTSVLKIVDVRTKKCVFLRPRWWGETFLTPGHPGVRVRNVRGKSGPKSLCLWHFFLPLNTDSFSKRPPFDDPDLGVHFDGGYGLPILREGSHHVPALLSHDQLHRELRELLVELHVAILCQRQAGRV